MSFRSCCRSCFQPNGPDAEVSIRRESKMWPEKSRGDRWQEKLYRIQFPVTSCSSHPTRSLPLLKHWEAPGQCLPLMRLLNANWNWTSSNHPWSVQSPILSKKPNPVMLQKEKFYEHLTSDLIWHWWKAVWCGWASLKADSPTHFWSSITLVGYHSS